MRNRVKTWLGKAKTPLQNENFARKGKNAFTKRKRRSQKRKTLLLSEDVHRKGENALTERTIMISTFRIGTQYLHFTYFMWFCQEHISSKIVLTTSVVSVRPVLQIGDLGRFKDAFLHIRKPATQTPDETIKPLLPCRCECRQVAFQRLCAENIVVVEHFSESWSRPAKY